MVNALDIKPGMSFLNIGSGTGYLSTIAGCLLQGTGVNHGIDLDPDLLAHARDRHEHFLRENKDNKVTPAEFFLGNIFDVDEERSMHYDRIYVGAACPAPLKEKILQLLVPGRNGEGGGVLIGPMVGSQVQPSFIYYTYIWDVYVYMERTAVVGDGR